MAEYDANITWFQRTFRNVQYADQFSLSHLFAYHDLDLKKIIDILGYATNAQKELLTVGLQSNDIMRLSNLEASIMRAYSRPIAGTKLLTDSNLEFLSLMQAVVLKDSLLISSEKLDSIEKQINELLQLLHNSSREEISISLRIFLLRHLERMQAGIQNYYINGSLDLQDAMTAFVGNALFSPEITKEVKKTSLSSRITMLLTSIALVVGLFADRSNIEAGLADLVSLIAPSVLLPPSDTAKNMEEVQEDQKVKGKINP